MLLATPATALPTLGVSGRTLLQTATPAANEGDDGVLEGGGEGQGTAAPAPDEGDDGVLEGGGEGQGTAAAGEVEGEASQSAGLAMSSLAAATAAAAALLAL